MAIRVGAAPDARRVASAAVVAALAVSLRQPATSPRADRPPTPASVVPATVERPQSPDVSSVVAVVDDGEGSLCSGVLVARDLVLTARHCVATLRAGSCATARFGETRPSSALRVVVGASRRSRRTLAVRDVKTPETPSFCGADVALLRLVEPAPADVGVARLRIDAAAAGEPYVSVGYGGSDALGLDAGVRSTKGGLRIACAGGACPAGHGVLEGEFLGGDGVCAGDSGGPAFDADGRVVGVLSRGPRAVRCHSGIYVDVTRGGAGGAAQWVDTAARALGAVLDRAGGRRRSIEVEGGGDARQADAPSGSSTSVAKNRTTSPGVTMPTMRPERSTSR